MPSDPFAILDELATAIDTRTWVLVGGLMVHCHAERAELVHARPTDDVDLVIELQTQSYAAHAQVLTDLGFHPHEPLDSAAPLHRFIRADDTVDLMIPDRDVRSHRYLGRDLIQVPGSHSALKRTILHNLTADVAIRLPDVASALSLKGAAHQVPSVNPARHLQDAVTLFACGGPGGLDPAPSRSMRSHINHLVKCLSSSPEAWSIAPPRTRVLAAQCIAAARPDWEVPSFLTSTTPAARPRRRPAS